MTENEAQQQRWQRWLEMLSPAATSALFSSSKKIDDIDYESWFWLLEAREGHYPVVKRFHSIKAMAKYIGKLDGADVAVVPFIGSVLLLSKGPKRILFTQSGVAISCKTGKIVPVKLDSTELQNDFFLGPPELAQGTPLLEEEELADKAAAKVFNCRNIPDDDDEDEDDDDDDEDDNEEFDGIRGF